MLHFSDFLDKPIKKIKTGSELLLATYLDQHCAALLKERFSIADVSIEQHVLEKSIEMLYAIPRLDMKPEQRDIRLAIEQKNPTNCRLDLFFSSGIAQEDFKSITSDTYTFSFEDHLHRGKTKFYDYMLSSAYISLFAYVMVQGYLQKKKFVFAIDNSRLRPRDGVYSYLYVLRDYGNHILDEKNFSLVFDSADMICQPDFLAFREYQNQQGYMKKPSSRNLKHQACRSLWRVGDAVLFYTRADSRARKPDTPIARCVIGVIRDISEDGVKIEKYVNINTRLSLIHDIDEKMAIMGTHGYSRSSSQSVYTEADKVKFESFTSFYSWEDIGIDVATYDETVFILRVFQEDGTYQWFTNEEGKEVKMWLSTPDTIYAVLSDWGVNFNADRFKALYFAPYKKVPVWDVLKPYQKARKKPRK